MGYVDENGQIADNLSNLYTLVGSTVEKRVTEVSLSNGMAWSEDDATFYYIDTKSGRVDAFDYNIEEGTICE
jgi:sugar lactone lactonase YvrE